MRSSGKRCVISGVVSIRPCSIRCNISAQSQPSTLTALDQPQDFCGVAAIDAARFEREVFAVHIWQRQHLRTVVQSHYGDNGIRAGTLPCKAERIVGTGNLDDTICAAVVAVTTDKIDALFWRGYQNERVVVTHELRPQGRLLAYDNALRLLQHHAQQSAYSRRACADDGDGIFR